MYMRDHRFPKWFGDYFIEMGTKSVETDSEEQQRQGFAIRDNDWGNVEKYSGRKVVRSKQVLV